MLSVQGFMIALGIASKDDACGFCPMNTLLICIQKPQEQREMRLVIVGEVVAGRRCDFDFDRHLNHPWRRA